LRALVILSLALSLNACGGSSGLESAAPTAAIQASASQIAPGQLTVITWSSTNATSISINPAVAPAPLPGSGSATVTPAATTTYNMSASGPGGSAAAAVTVTVVAPGTARSPITHLIVVMMQNRSFDHLFGTYPLADGLDANAPSYHQIDSHGNTVSPTLLNSLTTSDLNHDRASYMAAYDEGRMDKYAFTNGELSMRFYDNTISGPAEDGRIFGVGTLWTYALQYTLADNFYPSAMSSEPANVLYMTAASFHDLYTSASLPYYDRCSAVVVARHGGTIAPPLTETNVGDQMTTNHVSWAWYQEKFNTSQDSTCVDYVPQENAFQYFTSTANSANVRNFVPADFQTTLSDGSLPSVIWITPAPYNSMHPGAGDIANGIEWLDNLVQSVKNSPVWPNTAIVVLWDESGGWYDHVPPPQLPNTIGLGARVPVILISPYGKPGIISHQQMDFVSILRFIQWNWGLGTFPDPIQSAREQQTGDLCDLLTISCSSP